MAEHQVKQSRRGPGRPREERVTGAVLDAVVDLVAERGMGALTMDAVAARAGVSKPAMYRRWATKQDLVIAAAESRIGSLSVPDMGDFRAELRAVLTARAQAYGQPGVGRLLAGVIGSAAEAEAEPGAYRDYTARVMSETRHLLERGVARGDVRPDADLAAAATLVASSLLFRLVGEQQIPDEALVESVVDLIGRAVGVPS
ncbi:MULTISPECIES: TetR/AcrR family transcriptional regulator [unclassified Streptomyces]|uniref:TetR/AcrR family transcriptional regulator n=1 Tax=unclassified Streptomyces TaxID=2593676 RepID=UPI0025529024|nr:MULTISPECIES: TetR/AcrR family transcriptional regulator [unclassified Streptomyces]WRZ62610.1 TetR/AcrR family transcriptional regulator [Streptomyces sp. NBC_01257]WSU56574.1 TetR/AcrR family transcriptional regulator [Streptomyces sp. NBC_01104]